MCAEARQKLSCFLEEKTIRFSFTLFGKVSTPVHTADCGVKKIGSFSQWCELLSLLFTQSSDLIKYFATSIF